jgi:hypothetical protein
VVTLGEFVRAGNLERGGLEGNKTYKLNGPFSLHPQPARMNTAPASRTKKDSGAVERTLTAVGLTLTDTAAATAQEV